MKPDIELILHQAIHRQCPAGKTAVLATGGLDSTALAFCARLLKPALFFAAVEHPQCAIYNRQAIQTSRRIADILRLKFHVIPISREIYVRQFPHVIRLMKHPIADPDIPAVSHLFIEIHKQGYSHVLSGIGSDEVFRLNPQRLHQFFQKAATDIVPIHQRLARHEKLNFVVPFLNKKCLTYNQHARSAERHGKQPLLEMLKQEPELYALMQDRRPQHSMIPESFLAPLFRTMPLMPAALSRNALFKRLINYHWRRTRAS